MKGIDTLYIEYAMKCNVEIMEKIEQAQEFLITVNMGLAGLAAMIFVLMLITIFKK